MSFDETSPSERLQATKGVSSDDPTEVRVSPLSPSAPVVADANEVFVAAPKLEKSGAEGAEMFSVETKLRREEEVQETAGSEGADAPRGRDQRVRQDLPDMPGLSIRIVMERYAGAYFESVERLPPTDSLDTLEAFKLSRSSL